MGVLFFLLTPYVVIGLGCQSLRWVSCLLVFMLGFNLTQGTVCQHIFRFMPALFKANDMFLNSWVLLKKDF